MYSFCDFAAELAKGGSLLETPLFGYGAYGSVNILHKKGDVLLHLLLRLAANY
jgi:hypothetical protein